MPLRVHRLLSALYVKTASRTAIAARNGPVRGLVQPHCWATAHCLPPCPHLISGRCHRSMGSSSWPPGEQRHANKSANPKESLLGSSESESADSSSAWIAGDSVKRRTSIDMRVVGPKGSREVAVLDGTTTMTSGPPDTFINPGYIVAPKGDGGMQDVVQTLKETLAVQLLAISKTSFVIGQSYIDLAMAEHTALQIQDAMKHYMEALKIYQAIQKRTHEQAHSDDSSAEDTEKAALRRKQARINEAKCYTYLGVVWRDWGDVTQAESYLTVSLQIKRDVLGVHHPLNVDTLNNLGSIHQMRGDFQSATDYYEDAIRILMSTLEDSQASPYMAIAYFNLGCCLREMKQWENARVALLRGLLISRSIFGDENITTKRIEETIDLVEKRQ
eukprot:GHVS01091487.1.p1 GENE.GHVS01091487.1~~GHVS01091487.1.p1  ORF type:complete len:388 (-),score=20.55 GHVS01091487.1:225-1388(-)